jgi:hypothetical protein
MTAQLASRLAISRLVLALFVATAGGAHGPSGEGSTLLVVVLDEMTGQRLPNAEVIDQDAATHRFTNDRGEARLEWPDANRLRLRVRQLGYRYADRTIERSTSGAATTDTVTFSLQRVAVSLPSVLSQAVGTCGTAADTLSARLAAPALEQLRLGASRYEEFRSARAVAPRCVAV